ncbi:MAG: PASTA domain-containing protein [Paludibacter sp.]|nr:PASTA domain-containing protein [Paludibacter sp.]
MDFKHFWKETFGGFVLKNVLLALLIFVALVWGILIGVDYYTHHGEAEIIPDLRGSYVEEAAVVLAKQGLYPMVIDSVYDREKQLGTIIEQIPPANSTVKRNRPIYLIVNSLQVRKVPMPDVNDVSYRQADAMLKSIGLYVSNVEYTPSEYKDLVTDVKYNGVSILSGTRLPEGSAVVLVVGSGLGNNNSIVPAIKGLALEDARQSILSSSFVIGAVNYDETPSGNESEYFIYRQRPSAGSALPTGSRIDIYLTKDKSRLDEIFEEDNTTESSDEQFF